MSRPGVGRNRVSHLNKRDPPSSAVNVGNSSQTRSTAGGMRGQKDKRKNATFLKRGGVGLEQVNHPTDLWLEGLKKEMSGRDTPPIFGQLSTLANKDI